MRPMLWRLLQVALSTECRPLLEALAELWRCATRATQCVAAMAWLAQELVATQMSKLERLGIERSKGLKGLHVLLEL